MWIGYLLTFVLSLYLQIWLHEIGHAVAGWAIGYEVTSLGTGRGKPLLAWIWRGLRFFVCRSAFFSGVAFVFPKRDDLTRPAKVLMHAGGVIANFLTASVIAIILHFAPDNGVLWLNLGIASLLVAGNIIPIRNLPESYASETDGASILDIIWPAKRSVDSSTFRDDLTGYQAIVTFLHDIGDARGAYRYSALLIPALLYCDELEAAKKMLPWLPVVERTDAKLRFEHALLRAKIALADDDDIAASEALDEADLLYAEEYGTDHWTTLQWTRFVWLLHMKRPEEALEIIDSLSTRHPIEEDTKIAVTLLTCRLHAILDLNGLDEGSKVYEEYLERRSVHESPALDLNVAHALAEAYGKVDDWDTAELYYRQALALVTKLEILPQADRDLIDDAQACFDHLGYVDDSELAQAKEALSRPTKEKRDAAKKQAHMDFLLRRNGEIAFGCICASLLIFVVARQDGDGVDFGSYLSMFSLVAAFMIVPIYLYGCFDRGFRPFAAPMVVVLTVLPWVAAFIIMHSI